MLEKNFCYILISLSIISADCQSAYATTIKANQIAKFKQSWVAKTLQLQREIDINTPITEATFLGTHNSYNSSAYQTPYRYPDPNHLISIYDQLEMGIRSVELDAHWSTTNTFAKDILLCHSDADHSECGYFDRKFSDGLAEIRDWLIANPKEVVLLYIERHLDGHEPRLAAILNQYLGDYIYKPSVVRNVNALPNSCVPLPGTLRKADVLRANKQLLIVTKGCDGTNPPYLELDKYPISWNDFGFAGIGMIPDRPFEFIDVMPDEYNPYPDCGKSVAFRHDVNHTSLWRVYEDGTMGSSHQQRMDIAEMKAVVRCGVNWQTMDQVTIADPRLQAAIWSWMPGYPNTNDGHCASYQTGKGIVNASCQQTRAGFACREQFTHMITAVTTEGHWNNGENACQKLGETWHYSAPVNGQQMDELRQAAVAKKLLGVWLNYVKDKTGSWIVKEAQRT